MQLSETNGRAADPRELGIGARYRLLGVAGLSSAVLAGGGVLPAVCLVQIAAQFQLTDEQCGRFFAVAPTTTLLTLPVFGLLGERWGKRGILAVGLALLAIAMAFYNTATNFSILLMGSTALGLSCSIIDALISPLTVDLFPYRTGPMMNLVHCCFQIGIVFCALLGGLYMSRQGDWNAMFFPLMIIAALLAAAFACSHFPAALVHSTPMKVAELLRSGAFWLCAVVIFVAGGVETGVIVWLPAFLQRQFDMVAISQWLSLTFGLSDPKPLLGALGLALFAAPMVVGRWFYGSVAERFGYLGTLMTSCVLASIALIGFGQAMSAVTSILWLALLGLALSGLWPTLLIHAGRTIQANPPTLFSLLAMAGLAGCSSCSWGVGFLSDAGFSLQVGLSALIVPVLAAFFAIVVMWFARGKQANSDGL